MNYHMSTRNVSQSLNIHENTIITKKILTLSGRLKQSPQLAVWPALALHRRTGRARHQESLALGEVNVDIL